MRVAGVTFYNNDGRNRQDILKDIYRRIGGIAVVNIIETTFEGSRAVKVVDEITKECIGWIPKNEIKTHKTFPKKMAIKVNVYKNTYFADIIENMVPSNKQYHIVKKYADAHDCEMPAYDTRAYGVAISKIKNKEKVC